MQDALYSYVRQQDYESYISALLTKDHKAQRHVMAVFALQAELAHIVRVTREPMTGFVRLAWWRERIGEIYHSKATKNQPTLEALDAFIQDCNPPFALFEALLDAYGDALEHKKAASTQPTVELLAYATAETHSKTLRFKKYIEEKKASKASKNKGNGVCCLAFRALVFDLLTK